MAGRLTEPLLPTEASPCGELPKRTSSNDAMEGVEANNWRMFGAMLSHLDEGYYKLASNTSSLAAGWHRDQDPASPSNKDGTLDTAASKNFGAFVAGAQPCLKINVAAHETMFDPELGRTLMSGVSSPKAVKEKLWVKVEDGPRAADTDAKSPKQVVSSAESADAPHHGLTVLEATLLMINYLMNIGVFSVPAVFATCGLETLGLILLAALICILTAAMLGQVLERLAIHGLPHSTYGDIARAAAGPGVASFMGLTGIAEVTMYGVGNFIVLAHTVSDLADWLDFRTVVVASTLLTTLLSSIPDKIYSYVTAVSTLSLSMACAAVLASGYDLPAWAEGSAAWSPVERLPVGFSMLIFGAACHPVLPSVFNAAGSREVYDRAIVSGWCIWAGFASAFGLAVWYMFGESVQVIATRNIGQDLQGGPLPAARGLAAFSACWMVLKLQGSQVPATRPLTEALAKAIGVRLPRGNGGLQCMLVSAPVLAITAILADFLQDKIGALESVSGGLLMSINAFMFPAFAYLRICEPEGYVSKASSMVAVLLGVALCVYVCVPWAR